MAATMKVIESGVSILFITQSIGPVALQLLTTYGVLVFQVNEVKYDKIGLRNIIRSNNTQ
jgi:predicted Fe-Mo cluster-binding NifX family protein